MDSTKLIEYKNLVVKSDSFRFIINYFLPRPHYSLLCDNLNLADNKFHRKLLKSIAFSESVRTDSDLLKNQVLAKIKRLFKLLSSNISCSILPRIILLNTSDEGKLVDSTLQILLNQLHKNEFDGSRFVCVEAFDPNMSEKSINKLAITKIIEAGRINPGSLCIVYITKMKELELKRKAAEFVNYCIEAFSQFKNAVIIIPFFITQGQMKSGKTKTPFSYDNIFQFSLSIDIKKWQRRIAREKILEDDCIIAE